MKKIFFVSIFILLISMSVLPACASTFTNYPGYFYGENEMLKSSLTENNTVECIFKGAVYHKPVQIEESDSVTDTQSYVYTDKAAQVQFTIPKNWSQVEFTTEKQYLTVKLANDFNSQAVIMYGALDLWLYMTEEERQGLARSDINNDYLTKSEVATMFGTSTSNVTKKKYGKCDYYLANVSQSAYGVTVKMVIALRMYNGWMYQFQFLGTSDSEYFDDFEQLLKSTEYFMNDDSTAVTLSTEEEGSDYVMRINFLSLFLSLLVTIVVYSIPIFIYRFFIVKTPVPSFQAKKITIIYAVVGFVVMTIINYAIDGNAASGGGLILWSFVNYKILTKDDFKLISFGKIKKDDHPRNHMEEILNSPEADSKEIMQNETDEQYLKSADIESTTDQTGNTEKEELIQIDFEISKESIESIENSVLSDVQNESQVTKFVYCRKCGTKHAADSNFCSKCGTRFLK